MVKITLDVLDRPVVLVEECPKCGIPGLHKMPRRILVVRLDESAVSYAKERYINRREVYNGRGYRSYSYGEGWDAERKWLEDLRMEYQAAVAAAKYYTYVLERECYSCDHVWYELIDRFESDYTAALLRERYPEGLVVQDSSLR